MTRKDPALTVLQISDTHLHAAADSRMRGVTTGEYHAGKADAVTGVQT